MQEQANAVKSSSFVLILLACLALLVPIGCQPEGTGSVKAPGPRGNDDNLGRPFGNNPDVKKKAVPAPKAEVAQPKNSRL